MPRAPARKKKAAKKRNSNAPGTPVVRRGQRRPYVKSTDEQVAERVDFVIRLFGTARYMSEIKAAMRERYGDLAAHTITEYVARARAQMHEARVDPQAVIDECVESLNHVRREGSPMAVVKAIEAKAKLLGLNAPEQKPISAPEAAPAVPPVVIVNVVTASMDGKSKPEPKP